MALLAFFVCFSFFCCLHHARHCTKRKEWQPSALVESPESGTGTLLKPQSFGQRCSTVSGRVNFTPQTGGGTPPVGFDSGKICFSANVFFSLSSFFSGLSASSQNALAQTHTHTGGHTHARTHTGLRDADVLYKSSGFATQTPRRVTQKRKPERKDVSK